MNKILKSLALPLLLSACASQVPAIAECAGKNRILIVGDSISIGYWPYLNIPGYCIDHYENTSDPDPTNKYSEFNARYSAWTMQNISSFLENKNYDLIVWNNGMWDILRDMEGGYAYGGMTAYGQNIQAIEKILTKKAPTIFMTTTPVPAGDFHRVEGDEKSVNDEATAALTLPIYDLHDWAAQHQELQLKNDVHWTEDGSRYLAEFVTNAIEENLK